MNFWRDNRFFLLVLLLGIVFGCLLQTAKAQTGSLYFSPSSGSVVAGQNFSLIIRTNTGGVAINAAEGSVVFDPSKVSISSVSKSDSIFSIWATEPKYSNAEGTLEFAGGIPNPGYSGSNGVVLVINFKAKTATTVKGYTEIVLVSGAVLANDGEGTNILASLGKANYFIGAAGIPLEPTSVPKEKPKTTDIVVKSLTHPDPEKWYSNNDPVFNWELSDSVDTVSYLITEKPTSNPGTIPDGLVDEVHFKDVPEGDNYFHIRLRKNNSWGEISHTKFRIDIKPPKEFNILRVDNFPSTRQPEILFETTDDLSGVERYEVFANNIGWVAIDKSSAGKPYKLSTQPYGTQEIVVKAIDTAGNSTSSSLIITIQGGFIDEIFKFIRKIFQNWLLPIFLVTLIALIYETLKHSKWWHGFIKYLHIEFKKKKKINILDLRDIKLPKK